LPLTTVRCSLGAMRMRQLSHQTLSSVLALSSFGAFIIPLCLVRTSRPFAKSRDLSDGVIRLMSALFERACQHQLCCGRRRAFSRTFTAVEGEQNRHAAFSAAHTEIPPRINLRPSRDIHKKPICVAKHAARGDTFEKKPPISRPSSPLPGFFLEVFDRHEEDSPGMNRRQR
jgi:hypothetical protein